MEFKLPVKRILIESIAAASLYKTILLRVLALPVFLVILFDLTWYQVIKVDSFLDTIIVNSAHLFFLTFICVNCHRIFLLGEGSVPLNGLSINIRYVKFLIWGFIFLLILFFSWYFMIFVFLNIFSSIPFVEIITGDDFIKENIFWIEKVPLIFSGYILARLSLILPSVAIDGNPSLRWSWEITKYNGWLMFILICLIPWIFSELINAVYRDEPSVFEVVFFHIITYLIVAVEVAFLSFSFKHFRDAKITF